MSSSPRTSDTLTPRSWNGHDDVVIVGGGLAGLFCALKLSPRPVTIVTAAPIGEGASSAWAQGGIAAAVGEGDTIDSHVADTLAAGAGTVDEKVIRAMAEEAPARINDLLKYGVPFDRDLEGKLMLSREAAHSHKRIVRVQGDRAGAAIMAALVSAVRNTPTIRVLEGLVVDDLFVDGRYVTGIHARPAGRAGKPMNLPARAVVLASGGIGGLYAITTNPREARGRGLAAAARAGAIIADPEFVQFHPTALDVGKDPAPLATEALRGEGAILVNKNGERFMLPVHADAELAPRDIVARGVFAEIQAGRGAFLDLTPVEKFAERFPTVFAACKGSNPGDIVLDPFNGSGTTVVAAALLGRKYVGLEQSEKYVEFARKRLAHALEKSSQSNGQAHAITAIHDPKRASKVMTETDAFGRKRVPRGKRKARQHAKSA